MPSCLTTSK